MCKHQDKSDADLNFVEQKSPKIKSLRFMVDILVNILENPAVCRLRRETELVAHSKSLNMLSPRVSYLQGSNHGNF